MISLYKSKRNDICTASPAQGLSHRSKWDIWKPLFFKVVQNFTGLKQLPFGILYLLLTTHSFKNYQVYIIGRQKVYLFCSFLYTARLCLAQYHDALISLHLASWTPRRLRVTKNPYLSLLTLPSLTYFSCFRYS